MNRFFSALAALVVCLIISAGCSGSGKVAFPATEQNSLITNAVQSVQAPTVLWGFYDVYLDLPAKTATVKLNRHAMFTANVVNILNGKPTSLSFHINGTPIGGDYIDVDIDVTLTHPFPGLTQYNGYDVRGIFMGDGSASMQYNPDHIYPVLGTDQVMLADPIDGFGGPDGYTRWFNQAEFFKGGMPLLQYTPGKMASPGYSGTATLCPYKYFADSLDKEEDLWTWFNDSGNANKTGVFSAGQANTRTYYLRFPNSKGVKFSYAVTANWKGADPGDHPSNASEAVGVDVVDESTVYYISPDVNGGNLIFDISLWDWDSTVNQSGVMADYTIFVESSVLSGVYGVSALDMTPIGGGEHYSTYHVEIPADNVQGTEGNMYWVISECADEDYSNEFGVQNDAWDDPLSAFFRFSLVVSGEATPPVAVASAEPNPQTECDGVFFSGLGSYDPDGGVIQKYEWDWDNDGVYDEEGAELYHVWEDPGTYWVQLRVTDDEGLTDELNSALEITIGPAGGWAETWGGNSDEWGQGIASDEAGNLYVTGYFLGSGVDFDPGSGTDPHSSNGDYDCFLSKFGPDGSFIWARTWGGPNFDMGRKITVDSTGIYLGGFFSSTVDFDPGAGTSSRTSNGYYDCWLSKFDFDGNFQWVQAWGGILEDHLYEVAADGSGSVYVSGAYLSPSVDFDPGSGDDTHVGKGSFDCWLSRFDSDGNFQWVQTWGGPGSEGAVAIALYGTDTLYCTGPFEQTVDFDPGSGYEYRSAINAADPWLSCFDSSGTYKWTDTWEATAEDKAYDVCTDSSGNVYVGGDFGYGSGGTIDIDPGTGVDIRNTISWYDCWLCKLSPSGSFIWGLTWGGNYGEGAYSLAADGSDNLYVAGYFRSDSVDFDPGSGTDVHNNVGWNSEPDIFLMKLGTDGTFDWARTWGSAGQDIGYEVMVRCPAVVHLYGVFCNTIDFNPVGGDSHNSVGGQDLYLMKMLSDGGW